MQTDTSESFRTVAATEDPCSALRVEGLLGDYGGLLRLRARLQPDRVAYISLSSGDEETARCTYGEFDHEVRRLAAALQAAGATGGRVLIIQGSDLQYTLAFWACLYAGATAVTTIVPSSREQMRRLGLVAADAGARHVLCQRSVRTRLEGTLELPEGTAWVAMDDLPEVEGSHLAIRPHCGAAFSVEHGGREVAVVAVELRRECLPGLDLDEVGRAILRRVALEHQVPLGEVVFLARGGCPKTTSGKVQRRRVRQMYLDGALESVGRHVGPTFSGRASA